MKNLFIRSQTLAMIKANDLEMTGSDLTASASMLSELLSDPDRFANEYYTNDYWTGVVDASELSQCESTYCPDINNVKLHFDFMGNVFMDKIPRSEWTKEQQEFFIKHRDLLYRNCDFDCEVNNRLVIPFYDAEVDN